MSSKLFTKPSLLWSLLLLHAIIVMGFWLWKLSVPYRLDFVELEVLNAVYWWKSGRLPYTYIDQLPAFQNHYGPTYEWLCTLSPEIVHPYFAGRLISLLSTISIMICIAIWVWKRTSALTFSFLAASLLLTAKPIFVWGILHRVDMLAVCLSVSGFAFVLLSKHLITVWIGVALMTLAFHTKLTVIAAPLACFLYLWNTDRRKAKIVGLGWFLLSLLGLVWLQAITDGAYLFSAQLGSLPTKFGKIFDMITRPITSSLFWVAAAIYAFHKADKSVKDTVKPEALYIVVSIAIAGITAANPGSSWNYLIEFYVALSLSTGILIGLLWQNDRLSLLTRVIAILVCHAVFALPHTGYFNRKDYKELVLYQQTYRLARERILPLVQERERIAIIDSQAGMDALLYYGQPNPIFLPLLSRQERRLSEEAMRTGRIDLVLVGDELTPLDER